LGVYLKVYLKHLKKKISTLPRPTPTPPRPITNFGDDDDRPRPIPRPIQPGPSVDPIRPPQKPLTNLFKPQQPRPIQPGPSVDPVRPPGFNPPFGIKKEFGPQQYFEQTGMQPDLQQKFPFGVGIRPDGTIQNMHPAAGGIRQPGIYQPGGPPRDPNMFATTPPRPGVQQPDMQYSGTLADIRDRLQYQPVGPRQIQQPGMQQPAPVGLGEYALRQQPAPLQQAPLPAAPNFAGQIPGAQQQAPLQQQAFSYGGRAGYQMGGGIMGSENEQDVFSRLENLNQNLDQVEQTLGTPYNNQSYGSPIFNALTSSPMLNYGQTPLTMAGGGISRSGYQEGGIGMEMMQPQMQEQAMMQDQAMMQPQMQQEPQMDLSQIDPSQIDPKRALELIIQMLIDQGIPPDQAREIAIQMVQAVAEGGMGEMSDERIEARFGGRIGYASGGIGSLVNREGYFLGSVIKGITGAVKGVVKGVTGAVKSIVKSDIGKLALAAAAIYATGGGALFGGPGFSFMGTPALGDALVSGSPGFFGNLGLSAGYGSALGTGTGIMGAIGSGLGNIASGFSGMGIGDLVSKYGTSALISGAAGALGGALGGMPQQQPGESDEDYKRRVEEYRLQYEQALNNPNPKFAPGQYPNNPFYPKTQMAANGGRIGYQEGGITDLIKQTTQQEFFGTPMMADGGRMRQNYFFGGLSKSIGNIMKKVKDENFTPVAPISGPTMSERLNELLSSGNKRFFQDRGNFSNYSLADLSNIREENDNYVYAANGGRMGYALGAEVPTRENQAGVTELDYREKGGFVPPIGIKEKADDIPAMLSNNEFVFTADAVRNAGNGSVNKGAERMYGLMKKLEAGGIV
jgi:hypothetical protein